MAYFVYAYYTNIDIDFDEKKKIRPLRISFSFNYRI